jgi:hypothetical protein
VGIRDDYCVKLRVIEIDYNPCSWDNEITITFSNMTQYKSKRNDFISLLDNAIKSTKRQVVGGANEQITTYSITPEVISQILRSSQFRNYMNGFTGGIIGTGTGSVTTGTVTADTVIAALVKAEEAQIKKLTSETAFITYLSSTLISAEKIVTSILEADEATIKKLSSSIINANEINADVANIKSLLAGNVGTGDLIAINLTAENVKISDAVIKELIAKKISVADLIAHSATVNEFSLITQNGKPSISFKGSTQQFYDANGNVRVQIGQDGNNNFNFIVRGVDGTTAIFDSTGIKKEGIPENTIVNQMIEPGTINKDRLSFQTVDTDENGKVDIANIVMNGEQFGAKYTSFVTETSGEIEGLKNLTQRIELIGDQVFVDDGTVITPSVITIIAVAKNTTVNKWFIDDAENTSYVSADKTKLFIPSSFMSDKKSITVKAVSADGKIYDLMNVYRVVDGSATITPVITSSMGTDFVDGQPVESTTLTCTVYKGAKIIEPKSYVWYQKLDTETDWVKIGTQTTVAVMLSLFTDLYSVRCDVDV